MVGRRSIDSIFNQLAIIFNFFASSVKHNSGIFGGLITNHDNSMVNSKMKSCLSRFLSWRHCVGTPVVDGLNISGLKIICQHHLSIHSDELAVDKQFELK